MDTVDHHVDHPGPADQAEQAEQAEQADPGTLATLREAEAPMTQLRARLTRDAEQADLLDVSYVLHDSPVGRLLMAATPLGLVRVAFEHQGVAEALAELARAVSPRVLRSSARLDDARRQVDDYLLGGRTGFDLALDRRLASGFRRRVQERLSTIGFGTVRSYGELAAECGSPGASRAVGTACATNPLPIVVPCHRVVRADGSVGQYAGGAELKRRLLAMEGAGGA